MKVVVKEMKNRTVFVLVALIAVIAGSLFVSTSDMEAAETIEETIECPVGVEVSTFRSIPSTSLVLEGDYPANTTLDRTMIAGIYRWTLTFTPVAVKTYDFRATDTHGNVWNIKLISTNPNNRETMNVMSGEAFMHQLKDPLYTITSIHEGAGWLWAYNSNKLHGTAPIADRETVYHFVLKGRTGDTTAYRQVDINVIPRCAIDIIQSSNGMITPSNDFNSLVNGKHTFEFKANTGFGLADVLIDGLSDPNAVKTGKYTLEAIREKHTVTAVFSPLFSVNVGANGGVYSSGSTMNTGTNDVLVDRGTNKQFVFVPNYGYKIDKIEVNGVNNTDAVKNGSYTFSYVQIGQSLNVTFVKTDFSITIEQISGETVITSENRNFQYGSKETVNFVPPVGYNISEILIDGVKNAAATNNKIYEFNMTKDFSVTVKLNQLSHYVSYSVSSGSGTGTISAVGSNNVLYGNDVTFNITSATGYRLSAVTLGTVELTGAELETVKASGKYTFYNVTEAKNIAVSFTKIGYDITILTDGNGTVNGKMFEVSKVLHGSSLKIDITPNAGYSVKGIIVDGVSITGTALYNAKNAKSYTLSGVQISQTVSISFEKIVYKITTDVIGNGVVSPDSRIDAINKEHDSSVTLKFTPNTGYGISSVRLNGISLGSTELSNIQSAGTYEIKNISRDHKIEVTFDRTDFDITLMQKFGETVIATEKRNIQYGARETVKFVPPVGYGISEIFIDGVRNTTATDNKSHGFTMTRDYSVVVYLSRLSYTISSSVSFGTGTGTISMVGSGEVLHGNDRTFNIVPATGCQLSAVTLGTASLTGAELEGVKASGRYTFHNVTEAKSITVSFTKAEYDITILTDGNGTVNGKMFEVSKVLHGSSLKIDITPNAGYSIKAITIDAVPISGTALNNSKTANYYTLNGVQRSQTVSIAFEIVLEKLTYNVVTTRISDTTNDETKTVKWGTDLIYQFSTPAGYCVHEVSVDGIVRSELKNATSYKFQNVKEDHTISIRFSKINYTVTITAKGPGGSIFSTEKNDIEHGQTKEFTFPVIEGHVISGLMVNTSTVPLGPSFTISNVNKDQSMIVTYSKTVFTMTAIKTDGGNVIFGGGKTVKYGEDLKVNISPNEGFKISQIYIDGKSTTIYEIDIAKATGTYVFVNVKKVHSIEVLFDRLSYPITAFAGENGKVTGNAEAKYQASAVITITPDPGYVIGSVTVNGTPIKGSELDNIKALGKYTLSNINKPHSIFVSFEKTYHLISMQAGAGGTVSSDNKVNSIKVQHGGEVVLNFHPDTGYRVLSVALDEKTLVPTDIDIIRIYGSFKVDDVRGNISVSVTFEKATFRVQISAGMGGSITTPSAGANTVLYGDDLEITVSANEGYAVKDVKVDGKSVAELNDGNYVFKNITSNRSFNVTFEKVIPKITVTVSGNGTVTPNVTEIAWKGDQKYQFIPNEGYRIDSVFIDGIRNSSAESNGNHSFNGVVKDHTIHVTFVKKHFNVTLVKEIAGDTSSDAAIVEYGTLKKVEFAPPEGYVISSVRVNNVENNKAKTDGFIDLNVKSEYDIKVTFIKKTYSVSLSTIGNGTTTPNNTVNVGHGDELNILIVPAVGNVINSITFNNDQLSENVLEIIRITGTYRLENITNACSLNVVFERIAYDVAFSSTGNGKVNSGSDGVKGTYHGGTVDVSIVPAAGYFVKDVIVDGSFLKDDVLDSIRMNKKIIFANVTSNHTVSVTFERIEYKIMTNSGEHGNILPNSVADVVRVFHGEGFTFSIVPDVGYRLLSLDRTGSISGITELSDVRTTGKLRIENVTSDVVISVSFERIPYTISISKSGGTSGTSAEFKTVLHGDDLMLSVIPETGHGIADVKVNGETIRDMESIRNTNEYHLKNVTANNDISIIFEKNVPLISISQVGMGTVTPNGVRELTWNGNQKIDFQAEKGYYIEKIIIDGTENEDAKIEGSYIFDNVKEDHELCVIFAKIRFNIALTKIIDGNPMTENIVIEYGDSMTIDLEIEEGHIISSVLVDNVTNEKAKNDRYFEFDVVTDDHEVKVNISRKEYSISLDSSGTGSVLSDANEVKHGDDIEIKITPETGNVIRSVTINGRELNDTELNILKIVGVHRIVNVTQAQRVDVIFENIAYGVEFSSTGSGKINSKVSGTEGTYHGGNVVLLIVPDEGYFVKDIIVDGKFLKSDEIAYAVADGLTLSNVMKGHMVGVTFEKTTHIVRIENGEHGTTSPSAGDVRVQNGDGFVMNAYPETGYRVSFVEYNGTQITALQMEVLRTSGKLTFEDVMSDINISVSFEKIPYTISFFSGDGGNINGSTSGKITVLHGDNAKLSMVSDDGFRIIEVKADGTAVDITGVENVNEYHFIGVTRDHELTVFFERIVPRIIVTATDGGNISPGGVTTVTWKGHQNFEFDPLMGHYVKTVFINGIENVEAKTRGSYFFNNVQNDHTVHVIFAKKEFCITVAKDIDNDISTERIVAEYGETKRIDLAPAEGHELISVFVDLLDNKTAKADGFIEFKNIETDHVISVMMKRIEYYLSSSSAGNGTVTSDENVVHYGADVIIRISPDAGNVIHSVIVNGIPLADGELVITKITKTYTLLKITKDQSIEVIFKEMPYNITYSSGEHGNINAGTYGKITVGHGKSAELYITPDKGYRIENISLDGVCLKDKALNDAISAGKIVLADVTEDHSVIVSFAKRTYMMTSVIKGNGSIVPNNGSGITASYGENVKFDLIPDPGYRVSDVIVDGVSRKDNVHANGYELRNVSADHVIEVMFERIVLSILITADANGIVTYVGDKGGIHAASSDPIRKIYGEDLEVNINPSNGYRLKSITENGKELSKEKLTDISASGMYILSHPTEDADVVISFERTSHTILMTADGGGSVIDGNNIVVRSRPGVSSSHASEVLNGNATVFEILPSTGYCIKSVTVNGNELKGDALETVKNELAYTFQKVEDDSSIEVKFKKMPLIVSSTVVGGNGSISKDGITDVQYGDSLYLEFYPDNEYKVKEVIINGESNRTAAENGYYVLEGIKNDISVQVSYESLHSGGTSIGIYVLSIICIAAFAVLIYGLIALQKVRKLSKRD